MQNKPIWKILVILIALMILVSSATLSIAVDDSSNNASDCLDEMPFYNAAIHVDHSQQSDHEIHIGYQPSTHQIAAMLAADKGWWEGDLAKFGIEKVEMKEFPSGPPEMTAMLAGDLDIAYVGVAPPIAAMYEGLDAKIVAGVQTQGSALVIRPELADEYEGPASLKGKTIATFPPGSIQHTVLSKWFLDNGIDPEREVNLKAMGPSEATTAISWKAVDAVFLPSPAPTIIEVAGNGVIVEWSGSIWPNHACCCVVASGEMIREHPEIVKQIIKTHIRATEYEIAHPNEAAEIYAQRHGADVSTIKRSINVSDMQWIHDPHLEVESGINYAAVIYDLNRERYEGRGVEVFEEEDIFDTSFYDEIRSVIPDVNAKSSIEWHTSDQNAMQIARSQNKPTMIFFYSDRCPASLKQKEVFSDTLVINMSKNFMPIVGSRELDTQYGIRYVPTIVFTNSQGEEVYRTVGYRDADTLVNEMQYALSLSTTLDVPFFSQRDPAWCDKKLDHSSYSIGKYGCALTSAAMVAKYFGYDTNPDRLNTSLTEVGGLDASGILYWKKVEEVSGGKVEWIGKAEGNWSRIDQELGNKNPVIADVSCSLGKHFIVFIGKNETEYYHLDPYDENRTVNKWPNGVHGEYTLNNLRIYHKGRRPGIASAQDVLRLDEHRSYVWTETGEKIPYVDFLNTDQLEGDILEFRIYVSKTGVPIPDNYVLELRTNMDKPRDWKFGEDIYHSASVIVWQGKNEHAYPFPSPIILTGVVPEPIRQVKEPGFEKYTIEGIGKDEVYVELTVGTSRDGATLETIQQKLSPSMNFFSTSEGINAAKREIEKNLEEARGKIGRTDLEEDIWALYEEGHPGWASKLSAHYKELIMERFENYFAEEKLQIGDIVKTTVYLHVRNITDWNNPLDSNNLIFTMHPPDEGVNPPYDVGKILDGLPKTDNQYGYTWWKIGWDNGEVGWSVEGPFDKPTEKWLVKTDKPFIKIQDLEDPFNYQGEYELNQTELRAEETKEEILQNVTKYAKKYKISPALIMAIIRQESDFIANAKGDYWNGEYHSFGYMQVSYGAANDTYKEYAGDEYKGTKEEWKNDGLDPETNIKYGVRYLRIQHDRIKDGCSGYDDVYGDILKSTISAYNAGHPTLTNRMCYVLGGKCNGQYAGVIEGKTVNGEHRGYKFFLSIRDTGLPVHNNKCVEDDKEIERHRVVVTILPQADFVEEIGGDNVQITVMVPSGASPHTYSPTPSQIRAFSKAKIYFKVGSGIEFEQTWIDKLRGVNPNMLVVDTSKGVTLMEKDPHIWLSPLNVRMMVGHIRDGLIEIDPEHEAEYTANRDKYLHELDEVDAYIHERLDRFTKNRVFMVYHPAFGYFASEYNLTQIAIEHKGKAPTPKVIQDCIDQARQYNLSYVYVAPQFSTDDAEVIAHEINGQTLFIDPLSLDYCANMRSIGVSLSLEME